MLTKKEKLLVRPWIEQRYHSHRDKVKSAVSVVDIQSPKARPHVSAKAKKRQRELERTKEIEKENVRLLQKLGVIMNTLRLDNYWKDPRPSFLKRELIYKPQTEKILSRSKSASPEVNLRGCAKRCLACNKDKRKQLRTNKVTPHDQSRITWDTKNYWNRTLDFEPICLKCGKSTKEDLFS